MSDFDYGQLRSFLEIPGDIEFDEGCILFDLALKGHCGQPPEMIVEVGCGHGRVTAFLAKACSLEGRGSVLAIDEFGKYAPEVINKKEFDMAGVLYRNLYKHRVSPWCLIMEGASGHAAKTVNKPVRMLYLGGSSQYDALKADFESWQPYLVPKGIVVFPEFGMDGAKTHALADHLVEGGRFEWQGILGTFAVLRKKPGDTKTVESFNLPRTAIPTEDSA